MRIIGCDLHACQQTLAMLDTATGEVVNMTLKLGSVPFFGLCSAHLPRKSPRYRSLSRQGEHWSWSALFTHIAFIGTLFLKAVAVSTAIRFGDHHNRRVSRHDDRLNRGTRETLHCAYTPLALVQSLG